MGNFYRIIGISGIAMSTAKMKALYILVGTLLFTSANATGVKIQEKGILSNSYMYCYEKYPNFWTTEVKRNWSAPWYELDNAYEIPLSGADLIYYPFPQKAEDSFFYIEHVGLLFEEWARFNTEVIIYDEVDFNNQQDLNRQAWLNAAKKLVTRKGCKDPLLIHSLVTLGYTDLYKYMWLNTATENNRGVKLKLRNVLYRNKPINLEVFLGRNRRWGAKVLP